MHNPTPDPNLLCIVPILTVAARRASNDQGTPWGHISSISGPTDARDNSGLVVWPAPRLHGTDALEDRPRKQDPFPGQGGRCRPYRVECTGSLLSLFLSFPPITPYMCKGWLPKNTFKPPIAPPSPKKRPKRILRSNLSLTESVWLRWCLRFGPHPPSARNGRSVDAPGERGFRERVQSSSAVAGSSRHLSSKELIRDAT